MILVRRFDGRYPTGWRSYRELGVILNQNAGYFFVHEDRGYGLVLDSSPPPSSLNLCPAQEALPPRYSLLSTDWDAQSVRSARSSQTVLSAAPTYHTFYTDPLAGVTTESGRFGEADYAYPIPKGVSKEERWATLPLHARAPRGKLVCVEGGENVSGTVEFSIKRPQTIRAISLVVSTRYLVRLWCC